MSEQLKGHDSNIKATKWDDLSEVGFAGEEQTSPERSLLESETQEKIKNNPGAKKGIAKIDYWRRGGFDIIYWKYY